MKNSSPKHATHFLSFISTFRDSNFFLFSHILSKLIGKMDHRTSYRHYEKHLCNGRLCNEDSLINDNANDGSL